METYGPCHLWRKSGLQGSREEQIVEAVCELMRVSMDDVLSKKRIQRVANARQVAMFVMRELTDLSFPRIGMFFERDHSTVIHAYQLIGRRLQTNPQWWSSIVLRVLAQVGPESAPERHMCSRCRQRAA